MVVNACDSSTEEAQTGDPCSSLTSQPCLTVSSGVARDPAHLKKIGLEEGSADRAQALPSTQETCVVLQAVLSLSHARHHKQKLL